MKNYVDCVEFKFKVFGREKNVNIKLPVFIYSRGKNVCFLLSLFWAFHMYSVFAPLSVLIKY